MTDIQITVFGKPDCPQCHTTKLHLEKVGLPYIYRDVTRDEEARELVFLLGYKTLPVVTVGDMHWSGYRYGKIKQLAKIHAGAADVSSLDAAAERYLEDGAA